MTGSQQNAPRAETAPLQRDNTRVHEERTATAADFGVGDTTGVPDATRPAFQQQSPEANQQLHGRIPGAQAPGGQSSGPHAQGGSGPHSQPPPPEAYQQQAYGQQFPPHPQQQAAQAYGYQQHPQHPAQRPHTPTNRQQPVQPEPPRPGSAISPSGWLLRGLVLLGVSLVSGLLWLLIKPDDPSEHAAPHPPGPQGKYQFQPELREEGFRGCANVSTEKIKDFFQQHQCDHLTRALYTTTLPDGQKVLTSVVTIRMPDPGAAAQLNSLVTADDTGNVVDLASAGRDLPSNYPKLKQDVGYYSQQQDRLVVVGESGYFGKSASYEDDRLVEVTKDAVRLGWPQDSGG